MPNKTFYTIKPVQASAKKGERVGEIVIYEEIGFWGVSAKVFYKELTALAKDADKLRLRINSPGGNLFDGLTMYNMLKEISIPVEVVIDGVAASAASFVAMAGDPVIMPDNAFMMLHLPKISSFGNSGQLRKDAEILDQMSLAVIGIYAAKTGMSTEELQDILTAETWLTAQEAVRLGFADEISARVEIAARAELRIYPHAPQVLIAAELPPNVEIQPMADDVKTVPAATPPAPSKSEAEIRAEAKAAAEAAANNRTAEIVALCRIAGQTSLAATYLMANASVEDVRAALLKQADEEDAEEVKTSLPAPKKEKKTESAPTLAEDLDPVKVYAKWNAKGKKSAA